VERIAKYSILILLFSLVTVPAYFYGGVELWTSTIFFYVALFAFLLSFLIRYPLTNISHSIKILFLLSSFPLFWAVVQSIPLPIPIIETISPKAAEIYRSANVNRFAPLTLSKQDTITFILQYASVFFAFWATAFYIRRRTTALMLLTAISLSATAYTIYGFIAALIEHTAGAMPNIRSTFVGYTHFAAFTGIGFFSTVALLFATLPSQIKENLHFLFSSRNDTKFHIKLLLIFLTIIIGLGILFSISRGAIAAGIVSFVLFLLLARTAPEAKWHRRIVVLAMVLCFVGLAIFFDIEPAVMRYKTLLETPDSRLYAWKTALTLIPFYALSGCGFYSFRYAFSPFKDDPRLRGIWSEAHNDYLNFLIEGGVITLILIFVIVFLYTRIITPLLTSERRHIRYVGAASLACSLFVGLQSIVDFQLHIPAVALPFAILTGCALGLNIAREKETEAPLLSVPPLRRLVSASVIMLTSVIVVILTLPLLKADYLFIKEAVPVYKEADSKKTKESIREANKVLSEVVLLNPLQSEAHFKLARTFVMLTDDSSALESFIKAIQTCPAEPRYRYHYALLIGRMGDDERAIGILKEVLKLDPTYAEAYFEVGKRLLLLSIKKNDERLLNDSLSTLKRTIEIDPNYLPSALDFVDKHLVKRNYLKAVVPVEPRYYVRYCEYLLSRGRYLWLALEAEWALSNFTPSEENAESLCCLRFLLGIARLNTGCEEKALEDFRLYLEKASNRYKAIQEIQAVFQKYEKWWESFDFWSSLSEGQYPYRVRLNEALALIHLGRYRQAWDRLKLVGAEDDVETYELMYLCALGEGRNKMALEYLAMLRHLQPNNVRYLIYTTQLLRNQGELKDALRAVEEALRIQPDNSDALRLRDELKEELLKK